MHSSGGIGAVTSVDQSELERLQYLIAQLKVENQALRQENKELRSGKRLNEIVVLPSHSPFEVLPSDDEGNVSELESEIYTHQVRKCTFQPNPFLIDLILERVVQNLDYKSLKNGRLVCKQWHTMLTPVFKQNSMIYAKLDLVERPMMTLETIFPVETEELQRYKALEIEFPDNLKYFVARDWMREYGRSLEYVRLGHCWSDVCGETVDHELLFPRSSNLRPFLLSCCPNLKELIIPVPFFEEDAPEIQIPLEDRPVHLKLLDIGINYDFDYIDPEFGELLREIFCLIAGVDTFRLRSVQKCSGLDFLIRYIKDKPELEVLENVRELDLIEYRMDSSMLSTLAEINFKNLRTLTLGQFSDFNRTDVVSLCHLLKHVKSNLEELKLGRRRCSKYEKPEYCIITLPKLPKLKVFHILSLCEWGITTMDFINQLPALEELVLEKLPTHPLWHGKLLFGSEVRMRLSSHNNLKVLHLNYNQHPISDAFQNIVEWFPNLEVLSFRLEMTNEYQAWRIIPQLSSLTKLQKLVVYAYSHDLKYILQSERCVSQFQNLQKIIIKDLTMQLMEENGMYVIKGKSVRRWSTVTLELHGFEIAKINQHPPPPSPPSSPFDFEIDTSWLSSGSDVNDSEESW